MGKSPELRHLVQHVSRQVRLRRAEHYGLRGLFWGAVAGAAVLVAKALLGFWALPLALALAVLGGLSGVLWGAARRVTPADAARLADRALGLEDRLATALEWDARADRTTLVDALVADAATRVTGARPKHAAPRLLPREARFLPVPVIVAVLLVLAPAVRAPWVRLPDLSQSGDEDAEDTVDRAGEAALDRAARPLARNPLDRALFEERDFAERKGTPGATMSGDAAAVFKDTALGTQRPDFNSFVKKGDDRLRMLERPDRLPDLASDFTSSDYKMVFRKSRELRGGLRPDQISPKKLRDLLQEMERLGRKGGGFSPDAAEGMEALDAGNQDKALEAMEKALSKMRAAEEQQRGGKSLRGGKEGARSGKERGQDGQGTGRDDEPGEGEGLLPGKGRSGAPKGEATQRLQATPYDASVEGEAGRGRKQSYGTNLTGRGASMQSRLQYMGVMGQYRKMMEDAIAREEVPRDFHSQVRDYFQSLDEQ